MSDALDAMEDSPDGYHPFLENDSPEIPDDDAEFRSDAGLPADGEERTDAR